MYKNVSNFFKFLGGPDNKKYIVINGVRLMSTKNNRYEEMRRYQQARKSVLIQHDKDLYVNSSNFLKHCETWGHVEYIAHLVNKNDIKDQYLALVEYAHVSAVTNIMKNTKHFSSSIIPVQSRSLYCTSYNETNGKGRSNRSKNNKNYSIITKTTEIHTPVKRTAEQLTSQLIKCTTMAEQMECIFKHYKMNDLDIKLRYFICVSLLDSLRGILPLCQIQPFGSLVSGLGDYTSDLDISLTFGAENKQSIKDWNMRNGCSGSSFYFLTKNRNKSERNLQQEGVEVVTGLLRTILPLYKEVICIANARVPLVKCLHAGLGIHCDISMDNGRGRSMSNLLSSWSEIDDRFPLLVFTIRSWARQQNITNIPSIGMSNFMIVLLIVHYLQVQQPPILPSIHNLAGRNDIEVCPDYVPHIVRKKFASQNAESLDKLLEGFFQYYLEFDFKNQGISIIRGDAYTLEESGIQSMVIDNPTEEKHNVCRNLRSEHVEDFIEKCCHAYMTIGSSDKLSDGNSESPWGVMDILGNIKDSEITESFVSTTDDKEQDSYIFGDADMKNEQFTRERLEKSYLTENTNGIRYYEDNSNMINAIETNHTVPPVNMSYFYNDDDEHGNASKHIFPVSGIEQNSSDILNENDKGRFIFNDNWKIT